MAQSPVVILFIGGGALWGVASNTPGLTYLLVDADNIEQGDERPALPVGVEYTDDKSTDVQLGDGWHWVE